MPLEESEICCGAAGTYNLTQPEMSERLGRRKMDHIEATGAEVVATGNVGCILQIARKIKERGSSIQVVHPVDLLDRAYRGTKPERILTWSFRPQVPEGGVRFSSPHLRRWAMTAADRHKFLPLALRVVGLIFIFGIYPLTVLWPSGSAWHSGRSGALRDDRRHLRDPGRVLVPSGTRSNPTSQPDLVRHLVKRGARVGHGSPVRS